MMKQELHHLAKAAEVSSASWRQRFRHGVHDEGHLRTVLHAVPPAAEFFANAEHSLRSIALEVISDLADDLGQYTGKWNPLGFIVWHLGVDAFGNSLRLHAWPSSPRQVETFSPGVHCHAWYLSSYILAGGYRDSHYNLIEQGFYSEQERLQRGYLRKFSLEYLPSGASALVNRGECVSLEVRQMAEVFAGQVHHIKDGVLHATIIPPSIDTLTLVLDSPSLGYNTTTVLDCDQTFPTRSRRLASIDDVAHVQAILRRLVPSHVTSFTCT